jgi:hypothetical protein
MIRQCLLLPLLAFVSLTASAEADFSQYVGYTIVAVKYVAGYQDSDGKQGNDFQGCNFGRKIIFDDGTYLTCATYSYTYAFRPKAAILANGGQWVMIVGDNSYSMMR